MTLNERMLSSERVLGEGVAEKPANSGMKLDVIRGDQVIDLVIWG